MSAKPTSSKSATRDNRNRSAGTGSSRQPFLTDDVELSEGVPSSHGTTTPNTEPHLPPGSHTLVPPAAAPVSANHPDDASNGTQTVDASPRHTHDLLVGTGDCLQTTQPHTQVLEFLAQQLNDLSAQVDSLSTRVDDFGANRGSSRGSNSGSDSSSGSNSASEAEGQHSYWTSVKKVVCFKPLAGFLVAMSVAFWGAIMYLVFNIDMINDHHVKYWTHSLPGILLGGAVLMFILAVPFLALLDFIGGEKLEIDAILTSYLPAGSTLLVEIVAIIVIPLYIRFGAYNWYESLKWELDSDVLNGLPAPGFALFGDYNDAASASFSGDWAQCNFPKWTNDSSTDCSKNFQNTTAVLQDGPYGSVKYHTFNTSSDIAGPVYFTNSTEQLLLKVLVMWNSRRINESYTTAAPQNPTLYSIMYDPRMTIDDLTDALTCGMLGWTEQPALGSTTYTTFETLNTTDARGKLIDSNDPDMCKDLKRKLYTTFDGGYMSYRYHLSSSGTSYGSVCDLNGMTTVEESCISQVLIRYGSFGVTSLKSVHGYEKTQMLIDVAAIVGALTYVAWFLTVFK